MQRIGVISDTHLSETGRRSIPGRVFEYFRDADFILHAGDFTSRRAFNDLAARRARHRRARQQRSGASRIAALAPLRESKMSLSVCVTATGANRVTKNRWASFPATTRPPLMRLSLFEFEDDVNCLIFGHSHNPMLMWHRIDGREVLLLNPGFADRQTVRAALRMRNVDD